MKNAEVRRSGAPCCNVQRVEVPEEAHLERFARTLKALGHPVRLKIMHLLHRLGGGVCVCDLEAQFELSQPTISHHLRLLREAGLVETEQRGPWIHYSIRTPAIDALARHVERLGE